MKALSVELSSENFSIISTYPDLILTDMGSYVMDKMNEAHLEVDISSYVVPMEDSVRLQIELLNKLSMEDSGSFLNFTGDKLAL